MAAPASRGNTNVHQDYIVRIRYSNTLPPPPNPPKLLDIPNTGLASGQYTNPGFASRLAREQPLNIEADAELGMPLDLVGMPGIFDGDESSIQAPLYPPAPHPHDRALLRPLASLGKPKTSEASVSFLRRTEYISSHTGKSRFDSTTSKSLIHSTGSRVKKLPSNINKDSPEYIKAQVERSFEIAALKLQDPSRVRHPTKRNVKLVSSFPLLPDLNSFTDAGGYVNVKFQHNPVPPSNVYDTRIASSILRPLEPTADRQAARELAIANHEQDPERYPYPEYEMDFEFFLLEQGQNAANYKRKSDMLDARRDDESLYTHSNKDGSQAFRFKRVREYETATSVDYPSLRRYEEEIIVAINDGKDGVHQRAAFYYPLTQRTMIRPQRKKNMDQKRFGAQAEITEDGQHVDILDVKIRDADESELEFRGAWKENPLYEGPQDVIEETAETNGNGQQRHDSEDGEGESE